MEFPILVRGHYKDTVARYDIETLFIIIERYVKLYISDCVEIVHDKGYGDLCYCIHSFSILSSVESASIPCTSSIGCYQ